MSLAFYTQNHQMTFADALPPHHVENAWTLHPLQAYDVSFVIQNDGDCEEHGVQVHVVHSPYGIGLPGTTTNIIQPAPVNVPPRGPGGNGLATVTFQYLTPAAGHSCLNATIQPAGPTLYQNTDVLHVPFGTTSRLSFLVFGGLQPEVMKLTLTERFESGAPVPAAQSWHPVFVVPPVVPPIGPAAPTPSPINLNLPANSVYSIGVDVTVPPLQTTVHVLHIEGTVAGHNVGSVDLRVAPLDIPVKCDPFVHGGYHSSDVILYDLATGMPVPVSGMPDGDSLLRPNTDYGFAARVHNASIMPAENTVVRFWKIGGGLGMASPPWATATGTIPPMGSEIIYSPVPFRSAPAGQHACAIISIYNALAGTCPDAVTVAQVPSPVANPNHSCSAWRNTDSMYVFLLKDWRLHLELVTPPFPEPVPVQVALYTYHVPTGWEKNERVAQIVDVLGQGGTGNETPLYLLPTLRETLKPIELKLDLKAERTIEPIPALRDLGEAAAYVPRTPPARVFQAKLVNGKSLPFDIVGQVPGTAKPGDKIIVHAIAYYGKTEQWPYRLVEFTEILHVKQ